MDLYKRYQDMQQQKICLELNGMISQEILVGFVEVIEAKLAQGAENRRTIKKVFSIFIELAQNVLHYSAESIVAVKGKAKISTGIVVLSEEDDYYVISSGNLLAKTKVPQIVEQCDKINQLSTNELKGYYKVQVKAPQAEGSCGAGIGLIDIVRKSGNQLNYEVTEVDTNNSFLALSVKVQKEYDRWKT